jgi:hypothetical protein
MDRERPCAAFGDDYAPEPDLFIRTGGEQRISNFLLWQLAYSELYFTDVLWPEFDSAAFDAALPRISSASVDSGEPANSCRQFASGAHLRPARESMLRTRVITAVVPVCRLLLALFYLPPLGWLVFVTAVAACRCLGVGGR